MKPQNSQLGLSLARFDATLADCLCEEIRDPVPATRSPNETDFNLP